MHELSIARAVVREVETALADRPEVTVTTVRLEVGRLSGIVAGALHYGMSFVTAGTRLDGASVEIEDVPVVVWCTPCAAERETVGSSVRCGVCATPSADIRAGRGLQIVSVDIDQDSDQDSDQVDAEAREVARV